MSLVCVLYGEGVASVPMQVDTLQSLPAVCQNIQLPCGPQLEDTPAWHHRVVGGEDGYELPGVWER